MEDYKKKYEEALENIKKIKAANKDNKELVDFIEFKYPKLKESEDEKIRKSILEEFKVKAIGGHEENFFRNGVKIKDALAWLEKQGEEKPTDKIEPKFKVGDWCIDNEDGTIFQIVKVLRNTYIYRSNVGKEYSCTHYSLENDARLWTIKDAKDGDVLVFDNSFILIFKEIVDLNRPLLKNTRCFQFKSYIYLDFLMNVFEQGNFCDDKGNKCYPATKEQRDILFHKMYEAGYEWDAEKEELKKIEQKSNWSEEDEKFFKTALWHISYSVSNGKRIDEHCATTDWLKSVKERLESLRPHNISVTDEELAQAKKDAYNDALDKIEYHSGEPTFGDGWSAAIWYLKKKNGQPQNTWKPSEEQMNAIKEACDKHWEPDGLHPLYTLWEDLKKLRKE